MRLKGIDHCAVEQLLEHFRPSNSKLAQSSASAAAFWLLEHLISLDGPDLWVGSSLSSLNSALVELRLRERMCHRLPLRVAEEISIMKSLTQFHANSAGTLTN